MILSETHPIPSENLPVEALKAHLRMGTGFAEDTLQEPVLFSFLRAAVTAIESRISQILLQREFLWETPSQVIIGDGLRFPIRPVRSIVKIIAMDKAGMSSVLPPEAYQFSYQGDRQILQCAPADRGAAVTLLITMQVGIHSELNSIPADLLQAVMLLAAHFYEYREETNLKGGCMPFGVLSLIERYRPCRIYAGQMS
ncbi:hypothetical protein GN278_07065 [Rhodobacteraceae bacterium Araon29]